jgi:hypothetical protein
MTAVLRATCYPSGSSPRKVGLGSAAHQQLASRPVSWIVTRNTTQPFLPTSCACVELKRKFNVLRKTDSADMGFGIAMQVILVELKQHLPRPGLSSQVRGLTRSCTRARGRPKTDSLDIPPF